MRQLFQLTWGDYDCQYDYFFLAPEGATKEDFKNLCDNLLEKAALQSMKFGGDSPKYRNNPERADWKSYIGWDAIIEELTIILPEYGYELYTPPRVVYVGSMIIKEIEADPEFESDTHAAQRKMLGSTWVKLCQHNEQIDTERAAKINKITDG